MTDDAITKLGPAFAGYLRGYRDCFLQDRTATHFDNYCRGLLSDLPRKSVEPIALACGTAVRTLQEFLTTADWDHDRACEKLQRRLIQTVEQMPADELGTIGVIDETSCLKKGDKTPGVQRQYLGCVGKVDNGLVTVHLGVARGSFQALLDAEVFVPEKWTRDRKRCRGAGIPDAVPAQVAHRPGPVGASGGPGPAVRLAGVRRGVRIEGPVPAGLGRSEPTFRGRSAGELRGPDRRAPEGAPGR
ncbi:Mobile element protein [Frigoriglobus tundricola]|uniref:Mobile element protein n=1 Tax=Frigoriglobus tundricola TaxID=2774151 RepID=A0A6M5YEV0_9BACT|nr:Mobile element protein [Frigoriglobus tundricola]